MKLKTANVAAPRVRLDWRAYFVRFCEAHGNNPVEHGGRLLFADGWRYSSTDHAGPEWGPPSSEELKKLQRAYWEARLVLVERERGRLQATIIELEGLQSQRRVPLQQRTFAWSDDFAEDGHRMATISSSDVQLMPLQQRLKLLIADVAHCGKMLKELT